MLCFSMVGKLQATFNDYKKPDHFPHRKTYKLRFLQVLAYR